MLCSSSLLQLFTLSIISNRNNDHVTSNNQLPRLHLPPSLLPCSRSLPCRRSEFSAGSRGILRETAAIASRISCSFRSRERGTLRCAGNMARNCCAAAGSLCLPSSPHQSSRPRTSWLLLRCSFFNFISFFCVNGWNFGWFSSKSFFIIIASRFVLQKKQIRQFLNNLAAS